MMQNSEFSKMRDCSGFLQIGSHLGSSYTNSTDLILEEIIICLIIFSLNILRFKITLGLLFINSI